MKKFKIGDRVKISSGLHKGMVGEVCDVLGGGFSAGIKFNEPVFMGHNCGETCEDGHGWYFNNDRVEKIKEYKWEDL